MVYLIVKYENTNKIQPLNIVYISEEESIAKEKAYDLAFKLYGKYVEDLKDINKKYITNNFWNVKSIADYSDWSINLDGTFDNIVFSVIEIPDGILNY
jgi:hypothetical protein